MKPNMMKVNGKIKEAISGWLKKAKEFTVEESKVLSIRAQEAGRLTQLNARRYKLKKEYDHICEQIGTHILTLPTAGRKTDILGLPKIQELIGKAGQVERDLKLLDEEIEFFKKECDDKVNDVHRKAA